jgi:hypothetical protein
MGNKSKFSAFGLPLEARVDVDAASPVLRRKVFRVPVPAFTASATVKHNVGPIGYAGTVKAVYISFKTRPNIATSATARLVAWDSSANAEINLTDALDVEDTTTTLVDREAGAMVLAATNVALAADDTFEVHLIAGGAVTAAHVDGYMTIVFEASEDSVISD